MSAATTRAVLVSRSMCTNIVGGNAQLLPVAGSVGLASSIAGGTAMIMGATPVRAPPRREPEPTAARAPALVQLAALPAQSG